MAAPPRLFEPCEMLGIVAHHWKTFQLNSRRETMKDNFILLAQSLLILLLLQAIPNESSQLTLLARWHREPLPRAEQDLRLEL